MKILSISSLMAATLLAVCCYSAYCSPLEQQAQLQDQLRIRNGSSTGSAASKPPASTSATNLNNNNDQNAAATTTKIQDSRSVIVGDLHRLPAANSSGQLAEKSEVRRTTGGELDGLASANLLSILANAPDAGAYLPQLAQADSNHLLSMNLMPGKRRFDDNTALASTGRLQRNPAEQFIEPISERQLMELNRQLQSRGLLDEIQDALIDQQDNQPIADGRKLEQSAAATPGVRRQSQAQAEAGRRSDDNRAIFMRKVNQFNVFNENELSRGRAPRNQRREMESADAGDADIDESPMGPEMSNEAQARTANDIFKDDPEGDAEAGRSPQSALQREAATNEPEEQERRMALPVARGQQQRQSARRSDGGQPLPAAAAAAPVANKRADDAFDYDEMDELEEAAERQQQQREQRRSGARSGAASSQLGARAATSGQSDELDPLSALINEPQRVTGRRANANNQAANDGNSNQVTNDIAEVSGDEDSDSSNLRTKKSRPEVEVILPAAGLKTKKAKASSAAAAVSSEDDEAASSSQVAAGASDLQAAAGHHHGHSHGHYYQYAGVPKKKAWKFGFKRGNHKHTIMREEKGHKNKFHSSFKWHAKEKCKKHSKCESKGKMTWHYEHHDKKKHHGHHY